jgi:SnoaL-like domain
VQTGEALLTAHVARFNAGVRSGDFGPMVDWFTEDAELAFEGIPVGPFHGREAIAAAYRAQPPDDEIELLEVVQDSDGGWSRPTPGARVPVSAREHLSWYRERGGSLAWWFTTAPKAIGRRGILLRG